jgi:uncharacterized membrane protein
VLRQAVAGLCLLGIAIAGYLTWVHYADLEPICAASGGCERVQNSDYAQLAGLPVAVLGLAGYVAILATLALPDERGRVAGAFLALVGFGFSVYLTYLELFVIDAICQWCVASAVVMTLLLGATLARMLIAPEAQPPPA